MFFLRRPNKLPTVLSTLFLPLALPAYANPTGTLLGSNNSGFLSLAFIALCVAIALQIVLIFRIRNQTKINKGTPSNAEPENAKHQLFREIVRHEATEELLRETQEYMNCMINSMPAVLIGITPDGYITHWNDSAAKVAKLTAEEAVGSHIEQAFPELPVSMEVVGETIRSGIPYNSDNIKDGVGSQATFTSLTIYPLMSTEMSGAVILAEDVTPRVRMENLLIQNEKMMSLGELAAGVAHEINNPLAGILSNTQNIQRRISLDLPANRDQARKLDLNLEQTYAYLDKRSIPQFLENIREAGERAANIVKSLLEFSRGNDIKHQHIELKTLINHTLDLATNTFEVQLHSGSGLPSIKTELIDESVKAYCSPTEIQQVLLNLLRNAVQALQSNPKEHACPPEICISLSQTKSHAVIRVSDNGPGIPEEIQMHIFEPFYTTKELGQGTGLGLSVSYFIIKEHHEGSIEVESEQDKGTSFIIKLPRSES